MGREARAGREIKRGRSGRWRPTRPRRPPARRAPALMFALLVAGGMTAMAALIVGALVVVPLWLLLPGLGLLALAAAYVMGLVWLAPLGARVSGRALQARLRAGMVGGGLIGASAAALVGVLVGALPPEVSPYLLASKHQQVALSELPRGVAPGTLLALEGVGCGAHEGTYTPTSGRTNPPTFARSLVGPSGEVRAWATWGALETSPCAQARSGTWRALVLPRPWYGTSRASAIAAAAPDEDAAQAPALIVFHGAMTPEAARSARRSSLAWSWLAAALLWLGWCLALWRRLMGPARS